MLFRSFTLKGFTVNVYSDLLYVSFCPIGISSIKGIIDFSIISSSESLFIFSSFSSIFLLIFLICQKGWLFLLFLFYGPIYGFHSIC